MEYLNQSISNNTIKLDDFPSAVKVINVTGYNNARRISDLSLHIEDLNFAKECLEKINDDLDEFIKNALWRSAIIHFSKCFNSKGRFVLQPNQIYKNSAPDALNCFNYFKDLRNKHIAHDENPFAQSITGAILNKEDHSYKIEKIVSISVITETLNQNTWSNLTLLLSEAINWTTDEYDRCCDDLTAILQAKKHSDLLAHESINIPLPKHTDVSKKR